MKPNRQKRPTPARQKPAKGLAKGLAKKSARKPSGKPAIVSKSQGSKSEGSSRGALRLPSLWDAWADHVIPAYVKRTYSPKESWKNKPFTAEDARFFFKGVQALSALLTDERKGNVPNYFAHAKYRSGYLLYFLPMQASKFGSIFTMHPKAIDALLDHGKKTGKLTVMDVGAGPGTASLAMILSLMEISEKRKINLPDLELYWIDENTTILQDGANLIAEAAEFFSGKRKAAEWLKRIRIRTIPKAWDRAILETELPKEFSLILFGNLLNETPAPIEKFIRGTKETEDSQNLPTEMRAIRKLLLHASGAGVVFLEPAFRRPAQLLSTLRDFLFENEWVKKEGQGVWGPCLHAQACPLASGKDWCHLSIPIRFPGEWFRQISKGLGSIRQWAKFSYLWVASESWPTAAAPKDLRRVISDPITDSSGKSFVMLCEPSRPAKLYGYEAQGLSRGNLTELRHKKPTRSDPAGPLSRGQRRDGRQ